LSHLFFNHTATAISTEAHCHATNQIHHIPLTICCLPYARLQKMPNQHIFTLKMAAAMSAKTTDDFKHSMMFIPESQILYAELQP
jgi:hypothetical protein